MAFSFGSPLPTDQVSYGGAIQAPAPALSLDATVPQASQVMTAPSPQPPPNSGLTDIPVSPGEAFLSMLMHGGTPAEAAMRVRAVKLENLQTQMALGRARQAYEAMSQLPPSQQLAMFLNGPKAGEMLSEREFKPQILSGGQSLINGPGGAGVFAPQAGVTDAGVPYVIDQGGFRTLSPQLPGKKTADNGVVLDSNLGLTGERYATPQSVAPGATLVPFIPGYSGPAAPAPASGAPAQPQTANAQALLGKDGHLDPMAVFQHFTLGQEGGLNPSDGNGSPTNMGINQAANPDLDVRNLTQQQAAQRFGQYFQRSGAANMPPALGLVHSDTYFINPKMANRFLQQSGGDPNTYLALRQQWMDNLAKSNPNLAKYAGPWANRNAALHTLVGQFGGGQAQAGAAVPSEIGPGVGGKTYQTFGPDDPRAKNLPQGASGTEAPNGEITPIAGTFTTPDQIAAIKKGLLDNDSVKDYLTAHDAYGAMMKAAALPNGGMRAYALRDTFARTINPGAVARVGTIQAIAEAQGVPANIKAYFMNLKGDGNVPPEIAQQILDVSRGFLASHYGTAHSINESYADFAHRHHIDPQDVTVPMDGEPPRMIVGPVPPPQQRQTGAVYATPKGPLVYLGGGKWKAF